MTVVRLTFLACLGFVAFLLGACAMPSNYHTADLRGGFSEAQVDRAVFRVTYQGHIAQTQSQTNELVLLRGAEVAHSHGYAFFVSSGMVASGSALGLFAGTVSVPSTTMTIYCYPTRPETSSLVYEADQVIETLGPRYRRL